MTKILAQDYLAARKKRGSCNEPFFNDMLHQRLFGAPQDARRELVQAAAERAKNSDRYPIEIALVHACPFFPNYHYAMYRLEKIRMEAGESLAFELCQLIRACKGDARTAHELLEYFSKAIKNTGPDVLVRRSRLLRNDNVLTAVLHANSRLRNATLAVEAVVPMAEHLLHIGGREAVAEFTKRILENRARLEGKKTTNIASEIEQIGIDLSVVRALY